MGIFARCYNKNCDRKDCKFVHEKDVCFVNDCLCSKVHRKAKEIKRVKEALNGETPILTQELTGKSGSIVVTVGTKIRYSNCFLLSGVLVTCAHAFSDDGTFPDGMVVDVMMNNGVKTQLNTGWFKDKKEDMCFHPRHKLTAPSFKLGNVPAVGEPVQVRAYDKALGGWVQNVGVLKGAANGVVEYSTGTDKSYSGAAVLTKDYKVFAIHLAGPTHKGGPNAGLVITASKMAAVNGADYQTNFTPQRQL
jgi:hypothetical protein